MLKVPRWNRVPLAVGLALSILYIAGVGCDAGKDPYHLPAARVDGDQAVALFRREMERRALRGRFLSAERVETRTPSGGDPWTSGRDAWLVRLISEDGSGDLCGYVWRGEEAGRADGTVIRIRFDDGCRHWARAAASSRR